MHSVPTRGSDFQALKEITCRADTDVIHAHRANLLQMPQFLSHADDGVAVRASRRMRKRAMLEVKSPKGVTFVRSLRYSKLREVHKVGGTAVITAF